MYLKPKSTQLNAQAMLYKRKNVVQLAKNDAYYHFFNSNTYYYYDYDAGTFITTTEKPLKAVNLRYPTYFVDSNSNSLFAFTLGEGDQTVISKKPNEYYLWTALLKTNNVSIAQANKYIYAGNFTYNLKGDVEENLGATIDGLLTPNQSFSIQTYDNINLEQGDFVVIGDKLFSIESVSTTVKHLPKQYTIQRAIINNIL